MSTTYRPGQLYTGREGDLLFAIFPGGKVEFVTNRGTRVTLAEAERVYAPLTLTRDVGEQAPTAAELATAIRDALTVPAAVPGAERHRDQVLARRAAGLRDQLAHALTHSDELHRYWLQHAVRSIGRLADLVPVAYPVPDEYGVPTCPLCSARMEHELGFWQHEGTGRLTCASADGEDWQDPGNGTEFFACDHETTDTPGHDPNVCPLKPEAQQERDGGAL